MVGKKILLVLLFLGLPFILSACFNSNIKKVALNNSPSSFSYNNSDLGFSLVLPSELQYFITQTKSQTNITDLEFLVPTIDSRFAQEAPGYAKAFVVRVYNLNEDYSPDPSFQKIGQTDKKVYAIQFWQTLPRDWVVKWNNDLKIKIINSFKKSD